MQLNACLGACWLDFLQREEIKAKENDSHSWKQNPDLPPKRKEEGHWHCYFYGWKLGNNGREQMVKRKILSFLTPRWCVWIKDCNLVITSEHDFRHQAQYHHHPFPFQKCIIRASRNTSFKNPFWHTVEFLILEIELGKFWICK